MTAVPIMNAQRAGSNRFFNPIAEAPGKGESDLSHSPTAVPIALEAIREVLPA
jgi:hypothetical protein